MKDTAPIHLARMNGHKLAIEEEVDPAKIAAMAAFHPAVREWFSAVFPAPTLPQIMGWPTVARGESTLILAPTGTGKTLAAFLWCINRLMFRGFSVDAERCRVLYVSPIKALAVDVERNLRAPLIGISQAAQRLQTPYHQVSTAIRTGDTPPAERARFARHPADILITTPESLLPSDEDIVIETCRDEMGDRRVCVLTPFGSAVHAPWCMAATAKLRAERGLEVESLWSNDGFVLRVPDSDDTVSVEDLLPSPQEFKDLVLRQLGSTSLFAAKFREAAGRALLLPKRRPGVRAPLWQKAAGHVAARMRLRAGRR